MISSGERREELIDIWTDATNKVDEAIREAFTRDNTIHMMVHSGARGNWMQIRQLAGMRGLVANPKGETIPRPIKASFREGLSVLEFFISTHGARKGLADTALRTADSGYLTRRLVDVSQDVIIREGDCGTERGLVLPIATRNADGTLVIGNDVETSVYARALAEDVAGSDGKAAATAGTDLGDVVIRRLVEAGVEQVRVRSVLTCESKTGVCAMCYGRSLASGKLVDVGEAVGIVAAQSIGEPGTQLTMRTFHTGGVAGEDITHGLPRVVELFEARAPKGKAPIAEAVGRVRIDEDGKGPKIVVVPDDGAEEQAFPMSRRVNDWTNRRSPGIAQWRVQDGDKVEVGELLHAGTSDPHDVLRVLGQRAVQVFLTDQVQEVYRSQGVSIHDKHIEIIVRQMLRRITVLESSDADLLPGELVERSRFEEENRRVVAEGGQPASGSAAADGHHEGVARDRLVAVRGVVPGDDAGADGGGDQRQVRPADRAEGERHPRQAHPGRHRPVPVPQPAGRAHRGGQGGHVLDGRLRRRLLRLRVRPGLGRGCPARGLRLRLLQLRLTTRAPGFPMREPRRPPSCRPSSRPVRPDNSLAKGDATRRPDRSAAAQVVRPDNSPTGEDARRRPDTSSVRGAGLTGRTGDRSCLANLPQSSSERRSWSTTAASSR